MNSCNRIFGALLILTTTLSLSSPAAEVEPGFTSMFNGKDLTGWEGLPGAWSVVDGAITAESTPEKPCKQAHYIMWRGGKPGDFELRTDFRLQGAGGNSGIQFRSREVPNWDTSGYQADMENSDQWFGCLFEHTRGGIAMRGEKVLIDKEGKKTISPVAVPEKVQKLMDGNGVAGAKLSLNAALLKQVKMGEWNTYTIIAHGPDITLKINDVVMSQVTDHQSGIAAKDGIIALQMHPGPPMKVQFKDIRIKLLDPKSSN
ncbi:MAG: DUF1080 domain-containing protein [Verrucomicrobia bacterium]|nr:DUF1080 domain-containing protein [Verrucomicrobiota bacterium]